MITISYENLRRFIKSREGNAFKTISQGRKFYVLLIDTGFKYVPYSSNNSRNQSEDIIKQLLKRFGKTNSFKPVEYREIDKKTAAYLLSVIKNYLDSDYSFQTQGTLKSLYVGGFKAFAETQKIPLKKINLIYGGNSSGKSSIIHSLLLANHAIKTGDLDVHYPILSGEAVDLGGFNNYIHYSDEEDGDFSDHAGKESSQYRKFTPEDYGFPIISEIQVISTVDEINKIDRHNPINEFINGVNLGFDIPISILSRNCRTLFGKSDTIKVILNINRHIFENRIYDPTEDPNGILIVDDIGEAEISKYEIIVDGEILLSMSLAQTSEMLEFTQFNFESKLFDELKEALYKDGDSDSGNNLNNMLNKVFKDIGVTTNNFIPKGVELLPTEGIMVSPESLQNIEGDGSAIYIQLQDRIISILNELLNSISNIINERIGSFLYLGPLRAYFPRNMQFDQQKYLDLNWLAGGTHIWEIIRRDKHVRKAINNWLGNGKRQTPYRIATGEYIPLDEENINYFTSRLCKVISERLIKRLEKSNISWRRDLSRLEESIQIAIQTGDIDDEWNVSYNLNKMLDVRSQASKTLGWMRRESKKSDLFLIDIRSKTRVSHRDVGLGISQVIPVLGISYSSEDKIIAIEQPEIHLHPELQAELADVFIESALGERRNTFLLESHSEHLLLRIMRRMRETFEGKLPEGIPPITPDDVCVLFVQPKGSSSVVLELGLDEEGTLLDPWPGGFFEEGYRERFA